MTWPEGGQGKCEDWNAVEMTVPGGEAVKEMRGQGGDGPSYYFLPIFGSERRHY